MKIVTWNCNGALRKKFTCLKEFKADIFVVQECENPESAKDSKYREWAKKYIWTGERNSKGLGVFASENAVIEELDWKTEGLKYFIACKVNNRFTLLGTWCHGANSPTFGYIGQLWKYLQIHKAKLKNSIIAGDLNSNVIWDKRDVTLLKNLANLRSKAFIINTLKKHKEMSRGRHFTCTGIRKRLTTLTMFLLVRNSQNQLKK